MQTYEILRKMTGTTEKVAATDLTIGQVVRVDGVRYRVQAAPVVEPVTKTVTVQAYSEHNQHEALYLARGTRVAVVGEIASERPMVTRYALQTVNTTPLCYVFDLAKYTTPAATENLAQAKTWASARGAMAAATRHGLTNVEALPVLRDAADH